MVFDTVILDAEERAKRFIHHRSVQNKLCQRVPIAYPSEQRGPNAHTLKINEFSQSSEQRLQMIVKSQILLTYMILKV